MSLLVASELRYAVQPHFWKRKREILRGVSFAVEPGEIFGFLGPNGAGKTTTIKAILGLLRPHGGSVQLFGDDHPSPAARRRIGYMPEQPYYPVHLTAEELVLQHALLAGLSRRRARERTATVIERVGLRDTRRTRLGAFSKGMLQRAGLAQALVAEPELVILDEPMSGLDPIGRHDVRVLMQELRAEGKTVFFSTHILPDVELIADRVAMLVGGQVVRSDRIEALLKGTVQRVELVADGCTESTTAEVGRTGASVEPLTDGGTRFVLDDSAHANRAVDLLRAAGASLRSMQLERQSLEALFVSEVRPTSPATEESA